MRRLMLGAVSVAIAITAGCSALGRQAFKEPVVRLQDVRQFPRFPEAAIRQVVNSFLDPVALKIHLRTGIEHHAIDALLRERVRGHAARCSRTDDEYVVLRCSHDF